MTAEYLTVSELSPLIKYTEQSIYNLICNGTFTEGLHFFKPTPKKILFKWQAVVRWVENNENIATEGEDNVGTNRIGHKKSDSTQLSSLINI